MDKEWKRECGAVNGNDTCKESKKMHAQSCTMNTSDVMDRKERNGRNEREEMNNKCKEGNEEGMNE